MYRALYSNSPDAPMLSNPAPVNKGGTGANTADGAITNLGGISKFKANTPNNAVGLDEFGNIPVNLLPNNLFVEGVMLTGPNEVDRNTTTRYYITNGNNFKTITVTAISGSVTYTPGQYIDYTSPNTLGSSGFIVNGKTINITVGDPRILKPSIVSPVNYAIGVTVPLNITSSAIQVSSGTLTSHDSSDWQIATDANFSNIIQSLNANTTNKTSWSITDLVANVTYYVRVRYRGTLNGSSSVSEWGTYSIFSTLQDNIKIIANDPFSDAYFGYSVSISTDGNTCCIGSHGLDTINGVDSGAAYIFTRTGTVWTQQAKLIASDGSASDYFGYSVSLSADGNTCCVGVELKDSGGITNTGAVYIFTRSASTWTQQAILTASDKAINDRFGYSISLSADGNMCCIGANLKDSFEPNSAGAAYIFTRSSDNSNDDMFGYSVSLSADGNTCCIGAVYANIGINTHTGAAYIFTRSGSTWTQQAKLIASDGLSNDYFGTSVSITANGNICCVGASAVNIAGISFAGAAYIFTRSGTVWTQQTKLIANDSAFEDRFGISVSITTDGTICAIGANGSSHSNKTYPGAAYVFSYENTVWIQKNKIIASDANHNDSFGYSVGLSDSGLCVIGAYGCDHSMVNNAGAAYIANLNSTGLPINEEAILVSTTPDDDFYFGRFGDISNDGNTVVISAYGATQAGYTGAGTAYVYVRTNEVWSLQQEIINSNPATNDYFGCGATISGDGNTIALGAFNKNNGTGEVRIFTRAGTAWSYQGGVAASNATPGSYFGASVALSIDGNTLVVGSPYASPNSELNAGSIYVFVRSGSTWAQQTILDITDIGGATSNLFGNFVDITDNGDTVIAGAYQRNLAEGAAFIFTRSGSTWTRTGSLGLAAGDAESNAEFGTCVAISSDGITAAVGCPSKNVDGLTDCGAVYIFSKSTGSWIQQAKINPALKFAYDHFGAYVSLTDNGDILLVGCPDYENGAATNAGAAFIFKRSGSTWTEEAKIVASNAATEDTFGFTCSISSLGDTVLIGASRKDIASNTLAGTAYIFS